MEPFKEFINRDLIETLGTVMLRVWPEFDREKYLQVALEGLKTLELKQRVMQVTTALDATLPKDFDQMARILRASLHPNEDTERAGISFGPDGACGWAVWPLTELVVTRGMERAPESLKLLEEMTKRSSSEFAVRPFLAQWPERALPIFREWTRHENRHVRRLASEGSRPRLPWGMRLQALVDDPTPLFPILDAMKDDPEEYVRRSVANNLNDIAKDHPDLVADLAANWLEDAGKDRRRMVKHACRTLLKQGHPGALAAFGYAEIGDAAARIDIVSPTVVYGNSLEFNVVLDGLPVGINLMIDYVIHFVKANGSRAPKVFKWKDMQNISAPSVNANRRHAIKPITTRTYYPGRHVIEVMVNGASLAQAEFELVMP